MTDGDLNSLKPRQRTVIAPVVPFGVSAAEFGRRDLFSDCTILQQIMS